jgi:beta-lactamase class A
MWLPEDRSAWLWVASAFVCGGVVFGCVGYLYANSGDVTRYRGGVLRQSTENFEYIDPLLACDIGTEDAFPELAPIKSALQKQVNKNLQNGNAQQISIYFRTLNGARWFEIDGTEPYAPASLLKTFVMMAYYKEADETDNPELLAQHVAFEGSANPSQDDPGEIIPHLQDRKLYTVEQLIEQMIIYSDNDALNTLVDHFDPHTLNYFELIFKDLNIPSPVVQNESSLAFMTPEQYGMIFRVLYSSTYLSERYSEKALGVLAQAHYKEGLVAGVPHSVGVAHKFGVTTVPAATSTPKLNELHDCGIVYYPAHPYLLCIMTAGSSFGSLQSDIEALSKTAYEQFDAFVKRQSQQTATQASRLSCYYFLVKQADNSIPAWTACLGALSSLLAGVLLGLLAHSAVPPSFAAALDSIFSLREASVRYTYISPLLLCDASQPTQSSEFVALRSQIKTYATAQIAAGDISTTSVYFRDLKAGTWTSLNRNAQYNPASLLKVPLMIAVFKKAEEDHSFLGKELVYDGKSDLNAEEYFKPSYAIEPGHSYSVHDLLRYMIAYSDNNALDLLYRSLDPSFINEVYQNLSLEIPPDSPTVAFMSVSNYSEFFRVLYNATYLTREDSEEALRLLTEPDFMYGVKAAVPPGTTVAQKFGERSVFADDAQTQVVERELHDCGIIYYPGHPYLLCVMTRGRDFAAMSKVIQNITAITYATMSTLYQPIATQ